MEPLMRKVSESSSRSSYERVRLSMPDLRSTAQRTRPSRGACMSTALGRSPVRTMRTIWSSWSAGVRVSASQSGSRIIGSASSNSGGASALRTPEREPDLRVSTSTSPSSNTAGDSAIERERAGSVCVVGAWPAATERDRSHGLLGRLECIVGSGIVAGIDAGSAPERRAEGAGMLRAGASCSRGDSEYSGSMSSASSKTALAYAFMPGLDTSGESGSRGDGLLEPASE
mmetsp:Transcript_38860/g.115609  ORF Transcript_38860/g.115609 Transcript_38860/m.115609 type:complete len:229 (-) Transcript_38860:311-997(-)|eukprot:58073-Chlamydomonas_euryale.AAC.4